MDLGAEYNVRGLGRGDIAPEEVPEWGGGCCAAVGGWGLDDGFETCFFWVVVVMLMRMMLNIYIYICIYRLRL